MTTLHLLIEKVELTLKPLDVPLTAAVGAPFKAVIPRRAKDNALCKHICRTSHPSSCGRQASSPNLLRLPAFKEAATQVTASMQYCNQVHTVEGQ